MRLVRRWISLSIELHLTIDTSNLDDFERFLKLIKEELLSYKITNNKVTISLKEREGE